MALSKDTPVFFWGHSERNQFSFLSNWYPSNFIIDEITFNCVEQYMMYKKAQLFKDERIAINIINLSNTEQRKIKSYGRKVKNFNQSVWDEHKYLIVKNGLILKFSQNTDLADKLLATSNRELIEASPYDIIWGIGLDMKTAMKTPRELWGQNLLGKGLMEVRNELQSVN